MSIIVPMYNVSGLMERCVQSLLNQTYRNLELVFINDCSTDNTLLVLQRMLDAGNARDIECKIVSHDRNRGVAAARNTGLDTATGDYVYYVDADDYIELDAIEMMASIVNHKDVDIVACEWALVFGTNQRNMSLPKVCTGEELFRQMSYGKCRWNLWLFMVRRSLYTDNGFSFVEGVNMGEDMMLMLKMSTMAKTVEVVHRSLYHYIQTNVSAMSKDISSYYGQISSNVANVESFIKTAFGSKYDSEIAQLKLSLKLPLLISPKSENYKQWQEWWPETNGAIMDNPYLSWRTRLLQWAASHGWYWIIKLYFYCVIKVVYGVIYR